MLLPPSIFSDIRRFLACFMVQLKDYRGRVSVTHIHSTLPCLHSVLSPLSAGLRYILSPHNIANKPPHTPIDFAMPLSFGVRRWAKDMAQEFLDDTDTGKAVQALFNGESRAPEHTARMAFVNYKELVDTQHDSIPISATTLLPKKQDDQLHLTCIYYQRACFLCILFTCTTRWNGSASHFPSRY